MDPRTVAERLKAAETEYRAAQRAGDAARYAAAVRAYREAERVAMVVLEGSAHADDGSGGDAMTRGEWALVILSVALGLVSTNLAAYSAGHAEGRLAEDRECLVPAPPLCYDRWERMTVPTCDGGTQTLVAEPTFSVTCASNDPWWCR